MEHHLLAVSQATENHARKIGLGPAGALIGLLHDVGKYSSAFQRYLCQMALNLDTEDPDLVRGSVDHSTAGAQTVWRALKAKGNREGIVGEILALCIASHHSGLIDCIAPDGLDNLSRRMTKEDSATSHEEAWTRADPSVVARKEQCLADPELVAGMVKVISGIPESRTNENICRFKVGLLIRFLFSCLIDADRTDTADVSKPAAATLRMRGRYPPWKSLIGLLDKELATFSAAAPIEILRAQVSAACLKAATRPKGIFTLTVPTGGGKTLASLRFALSHAAQWGMDRIIYISPYTSIIDQNAEVARRILEPPGTPVGSVVLEHHSNLTPLEQTWRNKILSENWDAPLVFTTAVQFLESLFGERTRPVRRLHQTANSVLVFDEIQTLPIRCVHLFNNAANFLVEQCGSTVVLCTATQPLLHKVDEQKGAIRITRGSEMMPDVPGLFAAVRRHEILYHRRPDDWSHEEVAALARSEAVRAGSCLVVVNTKSEALSIFRQCRAVESAPVFHLSTAMCPAHRLAVLDEVRSRLNARLPAICVSTQLIEAGVDISFGSAIRALAGLDSIAQTAGRCNRHGEGLAGKVHVLKLKGDLPRALKEISIARGIAERVIGEQAQCPGIVPIDLSDPGLIERYFHYYFFERRKEMDYPVRATDAEREDTLLRMLSDNGMAVSTRRPDPQRYLLQSFMTAARAFQAIDSNSQGLIVPYSASGAQGQQVINELCGSFEPRKQFELLQLAQRFTVNVFPYFLRQLQSIGAVHEVQEGTGILHLDTRYYSNEFGLSLENPQEMETMFA